MTRAIAFAIVVCGAVCTVVVNADEKKVDLRSERVFLSKQQPQLKVEAVLTIDPVFGGPGQSGVQPGAEKFGNFCKWKSFYQTTDNNTLLGLPIRGDQITGADNTELKDLGPNSAHLKIAQDARVIKAFDDILSDYALLFPFGPSQKDWKGDCVIPNCFCSECC